MLPHGQVKGYGMNLVTRREQALHLLYFNVKESIQIFSEA